MSEIHPDFRVVVDTPDWHRVKPRIPDTLQRRQLEQQRRVREVVFGVQDGILTTMGIVTFFGVAANGRMTVLAAGLVALIAGALSMAVGEYQGSKSEREVVRASIELEKSEMEANPKDEFAEQVAYYKLKGFSSDEAHMIVSRLAKNPDIYLYEMMRDEFGIDPRIAESSAGRPAIAMGLSYAAGSLVPILPYTVPAAAPWNVVVSAALALAGLFAIGVYAGALGDRNRWLRGVEIALWGTAVFAISYAAGRLIPILFHQQAQGF